MLHIPPALRHRKFLLLWLGLLVSITGSQMQIWALFWHIRELTPHPIALGGIGAARILPVILFSLLGGAVADTLDRRHVLYLTQSTAALVAVALGFFTRSGAITIWHIYGLTMVQAVALAFDLPARQALVPNLVPPRDLPNAFSLTSIAFQTGAIIGPALSGLVIASYGLETVYFFNALTYLAVILAVAALGKVPQRIVSDVRHGVSLKAIREGIAFIRSRPIILSSMLLDFIATFFASANTLMPIVARDVLHVGVVEYGWLSAAQSVGAVVMALVISQVRELRRQGMLLMSAVVLFGLATVAFGLATRYAVAWIALALTGAADSLSMIIRNTIRQLQTPDHLRGRMTSINQIFFRGGPQLGEIEAGLVAQAFGAPVAIVTGGIGCLLGVLWIARRWPQLLRYNGDEPILAGAGG
ncbi:MAG: MFS transporter [Anaerolineae bacterium]|nr:MAG: MFS transporter [Anaerolineae bacterium]